MHKDTFPVELGTPRMNTHKQVLTTISTVCPLTFYEFGQSNFGFWQHGR